MSDRRFCYWSVASGPYAAMMATTIRSARAVGVDTDFHVWSDRPVPGAMTHPAGDYDPHLYLFKFRFLRDEVARLNYDYFVFLDADTFFVRHPGDVLRALHGAPLHAVLESDCTRPSNVRPDWWGCPLPVFASLMHERGVTSRAVFNTNAGFWIVHHDVIARATELALGFWEFCRTRGYEFTEEAPLAYVGHLFAGNPRQHTLETHPELWASDWTGVFAGRLPDDRVWDFEDYLDGHKIAVNPAIVHCMRSKPELIAASEFPVRDGSWEA